MSQYKIGKFYIEDWHFDNNTWRRNILIQDVCVGNLKLNTAIRICSTKIVWELWFINGILEKEYKLFFFRGWDNWWDNYYFDDLDSAKLNVDNFLIKLSMTLNFGLSDTMLRGGILPVMFGIN